MFVRGSCGNHFARNVDASTLTGAAFGSSNSSSTSSAIGSLSSAVCTATTSASSTRLSSSHTSSTRAQPRSRAASASSGEADAIELLTEDHRTVDELFEDYESIKDEGEDGDKEMLVAQICMSLEVHATIEEEIFYPAARGAIDQDDADMLDEAEVEHEHIKMLVEELKTMTAGEELYDAKVKVLSEYVKHHVKEEEGEIFKKGKKAKMDLEDLAAHMQARKEELMSEFGVAEAEASA